MHEGYIVGAIVLYGIWVTPLFILWSISLCLARRKHDPARGGLAWMKAVYPFWIVSLVFLAISQILSLWVQLTSEDIDYRNVGRIGAYVFTVGWFFKWIADILLLITLAELATGFLLCTGPAADLHKRVRLAMLSVGGLFLVLSIAWLGVNAKFYTTYYGYLVGGQASTASGRRVAEESRTVGRLEGAMQILFWLVSMPLLAYVSFAVHKLKSARHLRNSVALLLTSAILNFIRLTAAMGIAAATTLSSSSSTLRPDPALYPIVRPALDCIPMFVILVMLFTIGVRKHKGLWSTAPPPPPQWSSTTPGGGVPLVWQQGPPPQGYQQQVPQGYYPGVYYPQQQPAYPQPFPTGQQYGYPTGAPPGYPPQEGMAPVHEMQQPPQELKSDPVVKAGQV